MLSRSKLDINSKFKVKVLFAISLRLSVKHQRGPKCNNDPLIFLVSALYTILIYSIAESSIGEVALNTRPTPVIVSISTSGTEIVMLNLSRLFFQT